MTRIASLAGLLLLGASLCVSARTVPSSANSSTSVQRTDRTLQRQIVQRLHHDPHLSLVKVKVKDHQVTLRGAVPSYTDRQDAFAIANAVPGTTKVHNHIVTALDSLQTEMNMGATAEGGRTPHTQRK